MLHESEFVANEMHASDILCQKELQ